MDVDRVAELLPSIVKGRTEKERSSAGLPAPIGLTNVSPVLLALLEDMDETMAQLLSQSTLLLSDFEEIEANAVLAIRMVEAKQREAVTQHQSHRTIRKSGVGPLLSILCPGKVNFLGKLEVLNEVKTTFYKRRIARQCLIRLHFRLVGENDCEALGDLEFEVQLFKSTYPHERVQWTRRSKDYLEASILWGNKAILKSGELVFDRLAFTDGTTAFPLGRLDLAVVCLTSDLIQPFVLNGVRVKSRRKPS